MQELVRFYGIILRLENTFGNNTKNMRHLKQLKEKFGKVKDLGIARFENIVSTNSIIPYFTQATLEQMKIDDLKKICSENGI